ncbi:MAG TPA: hypothetical protein DCY88_16470 [Cyanobacteria bacterium UBA11372]|nr:hypothetical protein [Cyanobacteria bacterium UBA11372]
MMTPLFVFFYTCFLIYIFLQLSSQLRFWMGSSLSRGDDAIALFPAGGISIIQPRRHEEHEGRRKKEEIDHLLPGRE